MKVKVINIVQNQNTNTIIILPREATERERLAAEELQKYIKRISGVLLSIHHDDEKPSGDRILIGGPRRNRQTKKIIDEAEFDRLVPGLEGVFIQTCGDHTLLLAGSEKNANDCERGTLYAVYEFLERFLGCSLSAYSHPDLKAGEEVPHQNDIHVGKIFYCKAQADSPYRTAIVQYSDSAGNPNHQLNLPFLDWLSKNRYNRILTWASIYEEYKRNGMLWEAERRGIRFTVGHHEASKLFLPPEGNAYFSEKYYETHPEYYKLLENGTRYHLTDHWGQWVFCSRNQDVISQVSQNVIHWVSQNPLVDIVALWPNDGIAEQCSCALCKPYSKAENYVYFLNEVAKRVSAVHPDVKIDMLVYVDLWDCPDNIRLEPCLMVDESTWHSSGLRTVGKSDGGSLIGTMFETNLLKWHDAGAQVVYYDYYMGIYASRQRYIPMADEVQPIWKRFSEKGIMGAGTQIECFNLWNHIFNFYTFGRTAYDHSLSMEDNLERFCRIFGRGAEPIKTVIRLAESCLDGQAAIEQAGIYLMEHIDKETVYRCFEEALSAAETPRHRNNIRLFRMVFRYSDLELEEESSRIMDPYEKVKIYSDPTGELRNMNRFDSFWKNDPGYGITIPAGGEEKPFDADIWYLFE